MKLILSTLLVCLAATVAQPGEVVRQLAVDGKVYYDVRWGTVNQGKVVIFHNRGVATLPLDKLPPEYQELLGYQPPTPPPTPAPAVQPEVNPLTASPAAGSTTVVQKASPSQLLEAMRSQRDVPQVNSEWAAYNRDRLKRVLLDGKLVEKSSLKELTGIVIRTHTQFVSGQRSVTGAVLELAERRNDSAPVAQQMEMRPSLWQGMGVRILLRNFTPATEAGSVIRVYATEDEPIEEHPVYRVGKEPTFEEWQTLSRR